jgi:hypothetical protein
MIFLFSCTAGETPTPEPSIGPTAPATDTPIQPTEPPPAYQTYTIGEEMGGLAVSDLNGDGHSDIAALDMSIDGVRILFNKGDGSFQYEGDLATGIAPINIAAADLNGDSFTDLVITHAPEDETGKLSVLLNNGDGTFQKPMDYDTVTNWWVFPVDLDGDEDLDLVIENDVALDVPEYEARVWINSGNGTFEKGEGYPVETAMIGSVIAGDLDGDNYPDLIVRIYPEPKVYVLFGNGDGTFREPVDIETPGGLHDIIAVDLNADTHLDLAMVTAHGVVSVLFNAGDSTFQDRVDYDVGGEIYSIYAVDMDGDGSLDLVVGPTTAGNASLLTNQGDGTFELTKNYFFKGIWLSGFTISDVDGDGYQDMVGMSDDSVYVIPLKDIN